MIHLEKYVVYEKINQIASKDKKKTRGGDKYLRVVVNFTHKA